MALNDYTSAVARVSDNLRSLLPKSDSASIRQRYRQNPIGSYMTQTGINSSFGGVQNRGNNLFRSGGLYQTPQGSGLLSYKGRNPQLDLFSFMHGGPLSYKDMLARNQMNPKTAIGAQTQTNMNSSIGGGNLAGTIQWRDLMNEAGSSLNVPWQVLASIMAIESQGQNLTANGAGAVGLMQIVPTYWQGLADQYGGNLADPRTNIYTAAAILRQNYERYGSWEQAAAAYFGGAGAFNSDGSYSNSSDSFGTNITDYVTAFNNYMSQLGYGNPTAGETATGGQPATAWGATAVQNALAAQGTPYVWGGEEPGGFDCSGLVYWAYQNAGKVLPRTAQGQYDGTQRITSDQLQPGDLIFFSFPASVGGTGPGVNHVAMYIGNGQFVQSSSNGSVVGLRSLYDDFYQQYMVGFGRVY